MGFFTSPVTGAAQTGFTSPTYTLSDDSAPDSNGKQQAVTAVGGTQAGVIPHSVAAPFTITVVKPKNSKTLGPIDTATGAPRGVGGVNTYAVIVRKGVLPLSGQPYRTAIFRGEISIPAGADLADAANIKAMLSLAFGALSAQSATIGSLAQTGVMA